MIDRWFMDWINEVGTRIPRLEAKLAALPGPTLKDWKIAFEAKRITRDEAYAVIQALSVSPPYANRLAERAIALVGRRTRTQIQFQYSHELIAAGRGPAEVGFRI